MSAPNQNPAYLARLGAIVELLAGEVTTLVLTRSIEMVDERIGTALAASPLAARVRAFAAPGIAPAPSPPAPTPLPRAAKRAAAASLPPPPPPSRKAKKKKASKSRQRLPRHNRRYTKVELKTILVPLMVKHPTWGPSQLANEANLPKTSVRDLYNELKRSSTAKPQPAPPTPTPNLGAEDLDREINDRMRAVLGEQG